jgi:hypothetical protein
MKRMILVLVVVLGHTATAQEQLIFDYDAVAACLPDSETLCKGIAIGAGRIETCIKENASKLSPPCAEALARMIAQQSRPSPVDASPSPKRH